MKLAKLRVILLIVLFSVVSLAVGYKLGERKYTVSGDQVKSVDTSVMNDVLARLQKYYLHPEDIKADKLMYGAAEGMTASLGDPYTAFYPPSDNTRTKQDLQGKFGGVGIELGFSKEGALAVIAPIKGTPADKAGVKAGDLILKIKDEAKKVNKDTAGIKIDDAVDMIRGPVGSPVTLTLFSEGDSQAHDVTIVRDNINVPSTNISWVDNNQVAVLAVYKFGEQTLSEWNKMVDQVVAKHAKGVILDLRNNPGGFLQRAVDLGSEFIPNGVIVEQRDRIHTQVMDVDRKGRLIGMPLVVLINRGSASAAEILSGALRERLGVKLVGENSFGKGTVQEVQDLPNGAGLHVTVAEWLLPSGKNIHGIGLKPDVEVKYVADPKNPQADNQLAKALEVLKSEMK